MDKTYELDDKIMFGEFMGMTVKQAAEKKPRALLKEQNGTMFNLSDEAITYLKNRLQ